MTFKIRYFRKSIIKMPFFISSVNLNVLMVQYFRLFIYYVGGSLRFFTQNICIYLIL